MSHFRLVYMGCLTTLLSIYLFRRQSYFALITGILLAFNAALFLLFYGPLPSQASLGNTFSLLQLNVCAPIKDFSNAAKYILEAKSDIAVLEECNQNCFDDLSKNGAVSGYKYQYRLADKRLLILSQFSFVTEEMDFHADPAIALLTLDVAGKPIKLLGMHSTRPSSGAPYYRNQIRQFEQIGRIAKTSQIPFLMVGDFNTTPFGYSYRKLLQESGLNNSMIGFGYQASFPVFIPRIPKKFVFPIIPIDHILTSDDFVVLKRELGPDIGSDHLPVYVELGLRE